MSDEKLARLLREFQSAEAASLRAMEARMALEAGSTRARVTSANAKWARAAEHRDRCRAALEAYDAAHAPGGLLWRGSSGNE